MTSRAAADPKLYVELLLSVASLNARGRRTPCQAQPAAWDADSALHERHAAVEACDHCPVLPCCRAYADASGEQWHVWGGRDRSIRPDCTGHGTTRKETGGGHLGSSQRCAIDLARETPLSPQNQGSVSRNRWPA
jgi:hypothetical protein